MEPGDVVTCIDKKPFPNNTIAPAVVEGEIYTIKRKHICKCGESHLDVGLESEVETVTCYKCREVLPDSSLIHWAHISRFTQGMQQSLK